MKQAYSPPYASKPKFELGQVVATPGALKDVSPLECGDALARHLTGDWGDVCRHDWTENDVALDGGGGRLLSVYYTEDGRVLHPVTLDSRLPIVVTILTNISWQI